MTLDTLKLEREEEDKGEKKGWGRCAGKLDVTGLWAWVLWSYIAMMNLLRAQSSRRSDLKSTCRIVSRSTTTWVPPSVTTVEAFCGVWSSKAWSVKVQQRHDWLDGYRSVCFCTLQTKKIFTPKMLTLSNLIKSKFSVYFLHIKHVKH